MVSFSYCHRPVTAAAAAAFSKLYVTSIFFFSRHIVCWGQELLMVQLNDTSRTDAILYTDIYRDLKK
jgi:hypothetical protein